MTIEKMKIYYINNIFTWIVCLSGFIFNHRIKIDGSRW